MEHDSWFELVSAAADGQVDAAERARLDEHLEGCATCRQHLELFEADRRRHRLQTPVVRPELIGRVREARALQLTSGGQSRPRRTLAVRAAAVAAGAAAVVALVTVGASDEPTAQPVAAQTPGAVVVDAHAHSFDRAEVEIPAGATVEWRNTGDTRHTLVRKLGPVTVTEDLLPGRSEEAMFSQPGVYEFFCEIHPEMEGTVTVES